MRGDTVTKASKRRAQLLERARRGGRRLRRRRRDARAGGRAEVRRLVRQSCSTACGRSGRPSPRERRAELVEGIWARDRPSGPEATRRGGSAGSTSRCACRSCSTTCAGSPSRARDGRRRRPARHGRLLARPGGAAADVRRELVPRPRHDAPAGDPRARAEARPRADALRLGLEVRARRSRRARTRTTSGARRRGEHVRGDHRSRLRARARSRASAGSAHVFPGEPTIGGRYSALSPFGIVPAVLMGVDAARLLERAREMRDACRLGDGNPGYELGRAFGEGWREGATRSASPTPGRLRPLGRAADRGVDRQAGKGLVPAPGESPEGPDRQAREPELPDPYELGAEFFRWEFATAVAGAIPRDQSVRPAGRPGGEGQDERGARDRRGAGARAAGLGRGALAQAQDGDYVCVQAFVEPTAENDGRSRASSRGSGARAASSSRTATGRATCTRPGSSTRAARTRALPPGRRRPRRRAPDPRRAVRLPAADPGAGGGGLRDAAGARPAGRARPTRGGVAVQLGMVGLGRMGANMTERLRARRSRREDVRPERRVDTRPSLEELVQQLDAPRSFWLMVPAGNRRLRRRASLRPLLAAGDTIVDGGNSNYSTTSAARGELREPGHPLRRRRRQRRRLGPRARLLPDGRRRRRGRRRSSPCSRRSRRSRCRCRTPGREGDAAPEEQGWLHCGPSGAGHFVKMVHNGIEYGLMQAYAEGLNVLKHANVGIHAQETDAETTPLRDPDLYKYELDIAAIAELWRRGSVVRSWLLELTAQALARDARARRVRRLRRATRARAAGRCRRGRGGRPGAGARRRAVRPLRLARRGRLRRPRPLRDAQGVRRPPREEPGAVTDDRRASRRSRRTRSPAGLALRKHARPVRARHLRRLRRPDAQEAHAGALLARRPAPAARALRDRRRRAHRRGRRRVLPGGHAERR